MMNWGSSSQMMATAVVLAVLQIRGSSSFSESACASRNTRRAAGIDGIFCLSAIRGGLYPDDQHQSHKGSPFMDMASGIYTRVSSGPQGQSKAGNSYGPTTYRGDSISHGNARLGPGGMERESHREAPTAPQPSRAPVVSVKSDRQTSSLSRDETLRPRQQQHQEIRRPPPTHLGDAFVPYATSTRSHDTTSGRGRRTHPHAEIRRPPPSHLGDAFVPYETATRSRDAMSGRGRGRRTHPHDEIRRPPPNHLGDTFVPDPTQQMERRSPLQAPYDMHLPPNQESPQHQQDLPMYHRHQQQQQGNPYYQPVSTPESAHYQQEHRAPPQEDHSFSQQQQTWQPQETFNEQQEVPP